MATQSDVKSGNSVEARVIQARVWLIVTHGTKAWTLNKELMSNIEAFEIRYNDHVTDEETPERSV